MPDLAAAATPDRRVTVGVPAYNNGGTIARAIRSVQAQTFRGWRLIVSDDASQDETFAICRRLAERDQRIEVVRQPRNLLYMNFAAVLEAADTPYFAWLPMAPRVSGRLRVGARRASRSRIGAATLRIRRRDGHRGAAAGHGDDRRRLAGATLAYLAQPNGTRMYGLFLTEALRRAFPPRNMHAYDFAVTLAALREGAQVGIDRTLLTRSRTPWQEYPVPVLRLYRSRVLRTLRCST